MVVVDIEGHAWNKMGAAGTPISSKKKQVICDMLTEFILEHYLFDCVYALKGTAASVYNPKNQAATDFCHPSSYNCPAEFHCTEITLSNQAEEIDNTPCMTWLGQ